MAAAGTEKTKKSGEKNSVDETNPKRLSSDSPEPPASGKPSTPPESSTSSQDASSSSRQVVLEVLRLKKYFPLKKGFFFWRKQQDVKAVDDVSFKVHEREILGLVGESGCGKTTTGRLITKLEEPTAGVISFFGKDISTVKGAELKEFRKSMQMIFQDPYASLNPRLTVIECVAEPLYNFGMAHNEDEAVDAVVRALEDAELKPGKDYLERYPHELSGGQRQRVAIARALVVNPKFLVADEPVSMLDVSIRAGVMNLLLDLREKYNLPCVFITHDISVARYMSDRIAVMYLGQIVEIAETEEIILSPMHPYTQALLSAVPVADPNRERKDEELKIKGEIPSAIDIPPGCRFEPRCIFSKSERCKISCPELVEVRKGHFVRCHTHSKKS